MEFCHKSSTYNMNSANTTKSFIYILLSMLDVYIEFLHM